MLTDSFEMWHRGWYICERIAGEEVGENQKFKMASSGSFLMKKF
jgi:hypothetical protein